MRRHKTPHIYPLLLKYLLFTHLQRDTWNLNPNIKLIVAFIWHCFLCFYNMTSYIINSELSETFRLFAYRTLIISINQKRPEHTIKVIFACRTASPPKYCQFPIPHMSLLTNRCRRLCHVHTFLFCKVTFPNCLANCFCLSQSLLTSTYQVCT